MPDIKLRFPQPNISRERILERLQASKLYVDLTRAIHEMGCAGPDPDCDTIMVLLCVFIGDAEARMTTVSKIASYAGLPRATVYRRLESLIKIKKVTRSGRRYYLAPDSVAPDNHGRLTTVLNQYFG